MNNAFCNGWGKIYLTDDVFDNPGANPWDATPGFWDVVVQAVYVDTPDCPTQQTPTLVVPLYLDGSPGAHACRPLLINKLSLTRETARRQERPMKTNCGRT